MKKKAYYSNIQYMPSRLRMEGKNVGVILLVPGEGCRWIIRNDDNLNDYLEMVLPSFGRKIENANIQTLEELEHFAAIQANDIYVVPPRPMVVWEFEVDLQKLYRDLIQMN